MDMKEARGSLTVAALGAHIYAIGGGCVVSGGGPMKNHKSVEVFDPNLNSWVVGPEMAQPRFTTASAVLEGALFVCGGFDGTQYLSSVEMLDPRLGKWQPVSAPAAPDASLPLLRVLGAHGAWVTIP
jgi:hypothetical protein